MVEWTMGTPNTFATLTVEMMFLSNRSWSIERTASIWLG
jgi:hypothetical protein